MYEAIAGAVGTGINYGCEILLFFGNNKCFIQT